MTVSRPARYNSEPFSFLFPYLLSEREQKVTKETGKELLASLYGETSACRRSVLSSTAWLHYVLYKDYRWMFPKPLSESPTIKWETDLCAATHRRAHTAVLVSASVVVREIYSLILKGHLVWMLLVIIPKRKCQKYCWALQVDILGILTKTGGKFYFSLISDTLFFILSFQFLMSYPLWPLFSPKLQNQRFKQIQL